MRSGIGKFLSIAAISLATAGAFALVNVAKSEASTGRDCSKNSINYENKNGGCGAMSGSELVKDIQGNQPSDLKGIYNHFGLTSDKYSRFASTAKDAVVTRDGKVIVNGQTVMTGAHSYGRDKFNSYRQAETINGKTYYHSATQHSFASGVNSLPAMVMFDSKGAPEVVVIKECGNPVKGTPVKPSYVCKDLSMQSRGNDTYRFNSEFTVGGNAKVTKVYYDFGDGTKATKNPGEYVDHKFTKSSTITVSADIQLPGGQIVKATSKDCVKKVTVKPPVVVTPTYKCTLLTPTLLDKEKRAWRFTVTTTQSGGASVKDVDFSLDGQVTNRNIVTKDAAGKIYQDYTFGDTKEHTVSVSVNFTVAGATKAATAEACRVKIPADKEQTPMCPIPGYENIPVSDTEKCKAPEEPETPETPEELPSTGVSSLIGLFASTAVGGAIAHRLIWSRRS